MVKSGKEGREEEMKGRTGEDGRRMCVKVGVRKRKEGRGERITKQMHTRKIRKEFKDRRKASKLKERREKRKYGRKM